MADAGLPWSIPNAGFSIQPVNGEFAAWSRGSSVPPDGWSVLSGTWPSTLSRCQGGTGPYAVDFGQAGIPSTLVSDYIVVLPNTRYLLSALYRIVTGSGAALSQGVRVDWYDDSRSLISSNNVDLITNTAGVWTYSGADITSPIQAVYAKVVVGRFNVTGSTNLQVDAIKLDRAVYIPSGVISLDDVTDGVTYARPRGAYMTAGIINAVVRGAGTVGTDFLFKKPNISDPDTLDGVPDSATYGKVKNTMLTSGEVTSLSRGGSVYATSTFFQKALDNLDVVLDGSSFRKVGTAYVDASNRVTGVLRGTSPVAGADLFAKTLDTLDNVTDGASFRKVGTAYVDSSNRVTGVLRGTSPVAGADLFAKTLDTLDNVSNGTTYARVNATALTSGNPKTDSLVDGTYAKVLATQLTSGAITSLTRGGVSYATSTFFNTGLDTLDNVSNGTTYSRVNATALSAGNPKTDSLVDGTYAKVLATQLTAGAITSLTRGGVSYATTTFFNTGLDNLGSIANGGGFNKTSSTYVNTTGQITAVRRTGLDESVDNLFKKSSDTFASVAGTIATSQFGIGVVDTSALGSGSVTSAKIADLTVGAAELDDGVSLSAYDEANPAAVFDRSTATNATKGTYDGSTAYIRFTLAAGVTNPQISTTLYTGTSTNNRTTKAVVRYRISAGAVGKVTAMTAINNAATAQTATAVFLADGNWHTAVFDISGWTTAGTLRVDLTCTALATTGFWDISYLGTGNPGSGSGALASYQGRVGIGASTPSAPLDITGAHVSSRGLLSLNSSASSISAITFYPEGTYAGAVYGNTDDTLWVGTAGATALNLYTNGSASPRLVISGAGNVVINKPSSGAALSVTGTDGSFATIASTSNTASSFPQLQILNYGANGGYPVLATYNARGTLASPASPNSGDLLGAWLGYGYTLSSFVEGGRLQWTTTAAPGTTTLTTALDFYTSNNASSSAKARLSASGRLYIGGAVDAEELLEVRSGSSAYGLLHSNGTIKLGSYISTTEAQFGTKSNHDISFFTNNGAGRLRITAAGETRVVSLAGVGNRAVYSDANGALTNTASDATLKEEVQPLENTLPVVLAMRPVSFVWKDKQRFGPYNEVGFLAQEMLEAVPQVVGVNSDGTLALDYAKLTAVLAAAIQELKKQVDELANSRS